MILSPNTTYVTGYLPWIEYQTNFLNVSNAILDHHEIATMN